MPSKNERMKGKVRVGVKRDEKQRTYIATYS